MSMDDPKRLYECLLDYCAADETVQRIGIGLVWTVCQTRLRDELCSGLAMSPGSTIRTLPWPGTLAGQSLLNVAQGILQWEPYQASVAMAAINCSINKAWRIPEGETLEASTQGANLTVFEHFLPQLQDKKVVVIGHYPGIEQYCQQYGWQVLERMPSKGDYPDPAAEFLLPDADWVFISATSIINKTFPRLAELCVGAKTVLMGPTVPWLAQLYQFGIDYLAGIEVVDPEKLYQTAMEGGGVRIFETAVRYRIVELHADQALSWLKNDIAVDFSAKQRLTCAMENWYGNGKKQRFPQYRELDDINRRLSREDSAYKVLWDKSNKPETAKA